MAIKVNGQVVIDDSRQLTNIASLDATTVAALGAAGVGSSNPTYTANEAISKGQSFSVLADLTASLTEIPKVIGTSSFSNLGILLSGSSYGGMKFIRDQNIIVLMGKSASPGYGRIALVKIVDENNIVVGNAVNLSGTYAGSYQSAMDVALDGQGNGAAFYHSYRGTSGTHYHDGFTFAYDTTTMNISSVSGANRWGGDDYRFNCKIAAYDTNKFIFVKAGPHSVNGGLVYRTVSRSGGSMSIASSGSLGSSSGSTGITGAFGHTDPKVPTGRVLITGGQENNSSWNSSLSGIRNFASVISINSSGVPSIESVVTSSDSGHSINHSHNFYTHEADQGISPSGNFLAGRREDNTNSKLTMFNKASASSDTLTEVKATLPTDAFFGAIDLEEKVYYKTANNNSLQVFDFDGVRTSSSVMSNNTGQNFYFTYSSQYYKPAGVVIGSQLWDLPSTANNTSNTFVVATAGNTSKILGIANNTVSAGGEVELALPSSVVDGFSNLSVGDELGVGEVSGSIVVDGVPKLGVAISDTEVLIDTVIP